MWSSDSPAAQGDKDVMLGDQLLIQKCNAEVDELAVKVI